jgi:hypothetical protein
VLDLHVAIELGGFVRGEAAELFARHKLVYPRLD